MRDGEARLFHGLGARLRRQGCCLPKGQATGYVASPSHCLLTKQEPGSSSPRSPSFLRARGNTGGGREDEETLFLVLVHSFRHSADIH